MKKTIYIIVTVAVFCLSSFGQFQASSQFPDKLSSIQQGAYTKGQINKCIRDVFVEFSDELVFNSGSGRLELITEFFNRVSVVSKPEYTGKKFPLLSELALQNKYNKLLQRDSGDAFRPDNFNPLKYDFPMTAKIKVVYRVDGTDYLIIINPAR